MTTKTLVLQNGLMITASTAALRDQINQVIIGGVDPEGKWAYGDVTVSGLPHLKEAVKDSASAIMPAVLLFLEKHPVNGNGQTNIVEVKLDGDRWLNLYQGHQRLTRLGKDMNNLKPGDEDFVKALAPIAGVDPQRIEKALAKVSGEKPVRKDRPEKRNEHRERKERGKERDRNRTRDRVNFDYRVDRKSMELTGVASYPGAVRLEIHLWDRDNKAKGEQVPEVTSELRPDGTISVSFPNAVWNQTYLITTFNEAGEPIKDKQITPFEHFRHEDERETTPATEAPAAESLAPTTEATTDEPASTAKPKVEGLNDVTFHKGGIGKKSTVTGTAHCDGAELWMVIPKGLRATPENAVDKGDGPDASFNFEAKVGDEFRIIFKVAEEGVEARFTVEK